MKEQLGELLVIIGGKEYNLEELRVIIGEKETGNT